MIMDTEMTTPTPERNTHTHARIGKIIEDMEQLLPSESIDRPDYRRCRTTYGLLSTTYRRANDSNDPQKEYKELQQLENVLRMRLANLDASRGLPRKFKAPLDELKVAVDDALSEGVTIDFLIRGLRDVLEGRADAVPAPKPDPVKMVTEARFKKVWEELVVEKERNRRLNEENNRLVLEVKQLRRRERSGGEAMLKKQRFL